jgi:hypothetical protein
MDDPRVSRLVLRPKFEKQHEEFRGALDRVWRQGGWTVFIDELYYVDEELRLRALVNRLLTQGRDPGRISVVCGMQRPTNITRFAIGEASHVICFGLERRDAKILEHQKLAAVVEELPHHHFAWLHVPSRRIWRGKLDIRSGQLVGELV